MPTWALGGCSMCGHHFLRIPFLRRANRRDRPGPNHMTSACVHAEQRKRASVWLRLRIWICFHGDRVYIDVLCICECAAENVRRIFVLLKQPWGYASVWVWVCACMCKQLASLPAVLCTQKWRYSGWGYEVGGGVCRGWMRHLVLTVKNTREQDCHYSCS